MPENTDSFEITAPAPLDMFRQDHIDADNQKLADGDERARRLPRQKLKHLRKLRKQASAILDKHHYDDIRQKIADLKARWEQLDIQKANTDESEQHRRIRLEKRKIQQVKGKLLQRLEPAKPYAIRVLKIDQRIKEHEIAISNEKLYQQLRKEMAKEVKYFAEIIRTTYNRLGYCHRVTIGNKQKTYSVRFERFVVTEDEIQIKLHVTSISLFNQARGHLPEGVKAWDLVKEETLRELTIAVEREVESPHISENHTFKNGAWIVINRLGLSDGLFNQINLSVLMARYMDDKRHAFPLPFGVKRGRVINWVYLKDHPHLFINGQTGTGKSNLMHVILTTLIRKHSPDELKLVLIDLKEGLDFTDYEEVPHLLCPIIDRLEDVETILSKIEKLRIQRGYKIRGVGKNIDQYNANVEQSRRMPRIVVLIDEYNSINSGAMTTRQRINALCTSLAEKARAVGIHLILGTQVPYGDVIPKTVRANISVTMTGKHRTLSASISVVGTGEARKIGSVKGRMLCDNGNDLFLVQTPYCSNQDIIDAIEDAQNWQAPRPFELPALDEDEIEQQINEIERPKFTIDDFLRITINQYDGVIAPERIFEELDTTMSKRQLKKMADAVKSKDAILWDETTYILKPNGRGFRLEPETPEKPETPQKEVSIAGD